jgi:endoglycosylceramidase
MKAAQSNFWMNSTLQANLSNVWRMIAQHYANETTIGRYDILNEPWMYMTTSPADHAVNVASFYLKAMRSIEEVDPNHILFLEPAVMNSYSLPIKGNIVWSPHFYPLSSDSKYFHENVTILEADLASKYKQFVVPMGSPMWIGEFGAFMNDISYREWLQDATNLFDKYQIG